MVQGLAFLSKKSWHTKNLANQEKVWVAEQRNEAEANKTKELARQIQQEHEQEDLDRISGKKTIMDRGIDWMYQGGTTGDLAREDAAKKAEEFLLGKEYVGTGAVRGDFDDTGKKEGINNVLDTKPVPAAPLSMMGTAGELAFQRDDDDPTSVKHRNESFRLRVEDPMFLVNQKHREKTVKAEKNRALYEKVVGPTTSLVDADNADLKQHSKDSSKERRKDKKEMKREEKERRSDDKERRRHRRDDEDHRRKRHHSRSRSRSHERSRKSRRREGSYSRSRSKSSERHHDRTRQYRSEKSSGYNHHHRNEEEDRRRHKRAESPEEYDARHDRRADRNDDRKRTRPDSNDDDRSDRRRGDIPEKPSSRKHRNSNGDAYRRHGHHLEPNYASPGRDSHAPSRNSGSQGDGTAKGGFGLQGGAKRGSINRDDLGPSKDLLRQKRDEQEAERRRIRQAAAARRRVSGDDRSKALEEMKSDARRRDEVMARKASERPNHHDDEGARTGGQANFLHDITRRTHGIAEGGASLSSRVAQNRYTNQRSHESFL
jgi:N-terminal domain of CBF1 interacting co-repressor CIR